MVLSTATTRFEGVSPRLQPRLDPQREQSIEILMFDISRAYFNAKTSDGDPTYVEFPAEADAPPWHVRAAPQAHVRHTPGDRRLEGGWVMIGLYATKGWSATQVSLALTSGQAEYYGVVRAAGIRFGMQAWLKDAGVRLPLRIWTDSSAALRISARQDLCKLRNLECRSLWFH